MLKKERLMQNRTQQWGQIPRSIERNF